MKKTMKHFVIGVLLMTLLIPFIPTAVYANSRINVTIDGQWVAFDGQGPTIVGGRTLVPVRGVFEHLGFEADWDSSTQTATLIRDNDAETFIKVVLTIGRNTFTIYEPSADEAEQVLPLDVAAQMIGGRVMLPIRAVIEAIGFNVDWDATTSTVLITTRTITWLDQVGHTRHQSSGTDNTFSPWDPSRRTTNLMTVERGIVFRLSMLMSGRNYVDQEPVSFQSVEYLLNGRYSTFRAVLASVENEQWVGRNRQGAQLRIYGDGYLLYTSPMIAYESMPKDLIVDVSGITTLRFEVFVPHVSPGSGFVWLGLGNARLYRGRPHQVFAHGNYNYTEVTLLDHVGSLSHQTSGTDNTYGPWAYGRRATDGTTVERGIVFVLSVFMSGRNYVNDALVSYQSIEYQLDGRYHTFEAVLARVENEQWRGDNRQGAQLRIYGDGQRLYTSPIIADGTMPINLRIDVSGVDVLRFEVEIPNMSPGSGFAWVGLGDARLYRDR